MAKLSNIMLLGLPNSGKTHYSAQFYGRVTRVDTCSLNIRVDEGAPPDLTLFEDAFSSLAAGKTAQRTSTNTFGNITLPLISQSKQKIDLTWPDYAGEQLKSVFLDRVVNKQWIELLETASGWVLIIRLDEEIVIQDRLQQLLKSPPSSALELGRNDDIQKNNIDTIWDSNSKWIEIIQILLHSCHISFHNPIFTPKLAILLSCYDRLEEKFKLETPRNTLRAKLPLLDTYLHSIWNKDNISVWGISALGKNLEEDISDDSFVDEGPESQGWIITPEGEQISDLTLPISWLIQA